MKEHSNINGQITIELNEMRTYQDDKVEHIPLDFDIYANKKIALDRLNEIIKAADSQSI